MRLVQGGLCTGFFGRKQGRDPLLDALFRSDGGVDCAELALRAFLKPLDLAERHVAWITPIQLLLGFQFVQGLLVIALGLLELPFSLYDIHASHGHLGVDFRNLAARGLDGRLLLRTVEPEDRRTFGDWTAVANENFCDASVRFGKDRDGPKEQRGVGRRRVVVENHRDQAHRENQARRDSPPEFEPHGVKGYFLSNSLSLDISAIKIVRKDCQH